MDYIKANKKAWEEAFEHRKEGFDAEDIATKLNESPFFYLEPELQEALSSVLQENSIVAQFCCNNGRELLNAMNYGVKEGYGFDIAENMIQTATRASKLLEKNCTFIQSNIYEIDSVFNDRFDVIFITIGALTWFADLNAFFSVVSRCIKKGGTVLIHDSHPITNMIALDGEEGYDPKEPRKLIHNYFKSDPWTGAGCATYLSDGEGRTEESYCYSHTFMKIINALSNNGLCITSLQEYQKDLSELFESFNDSGIPLSYLLTAIK